MKLNKITPFLWFDKEAEEAMRFYCSVFKNSKPGTITHYGDSGPGPKGSVMTATFELEGLEITLLNGGPIFKLTEAASLHIACETQGEIDYLWEKLSEGGSKSQCGWLKDKFGLSWQVGHAHWAEMLNDTDRARAGRVMKAVMGMTKIDLAKIKQAAAG
jgi:predicted 3-demethylubiquinone-9 3-methyltransferase (glyoxalase superfamily)